MQISSTRAGFYPLPSPPSRPEAAASASADKPANETNRLVTAAEAATRPRPVTPPGEDNSRALVLARQAAGLLGAVDGVTGSSRLDARADVGAGRGSSSIFSASSAAQRAVAEYNTVAAQEQRYELTAVLGLDVFV